MNATFESIITLSQDVPEKLKALSEKTALLQQLSDDVESNLKEKQDSLEDSIEEINSLAEKLQQEYDERKTHIATEIEALEADTTDLVQTLSHAQEETGTEVEKANEFIGTVQLQIVEHDAAIQAGHQEVETIINTVQEHIGNFQAQIITAVGTVEGHISQLQTQITGAKDLASAQVANLSGSINATQQKVFEEIEAMVSEFVSLKSSFEEKLNFLNTDLIEQELESMITQVRNVIETELQELINAAIAKVLEMIESIAEKINDANSTTLAGRQEMEPLVEQMRDMLEPLQAVIDKIKDIAAGFMLGWG